MKHRNSTGLDWTGGLCVNQVGWNSECAQKPLVTRHAAGVERGAKRHRNHRWFLTWLQKNWLFVVVFVLSTVFFVVQHAQSDSWDFHAYVLNSEYLFHGGGYFEPLRPPLVPFMMGLLGFAGRGVAEYGYILFASVLLAFGVFRLSRSLSVNASCLYAVSCTFYVLMVGLTDGTELLALGFSYLFSSALVENKLAGHWLGLMALSRYTSLAFLPLLLVRKKDAWKDVAIFAAVMFPWLLYNYLTYGNWFASIADQYANNIFFRDYIHTPIEAGHFLYVANLLLPFSVIGLARRVLENIRGIKRKDVIFFAIAVITIIGYVNIPIKSSRYLFALALPIAVWAVEGVRGVSLLFNKRAVKWVCGALFIVSFIVALQSVAHSEKNESIYRNAIRDVAVLGPCSVMSNGWVELSYYGLTAQDFPRRELVNKSIEAGELIVLFPHIGEPDYAKDEEFIKNFHVSIRGEKYFVLGDGCAAPKKNDALFVKKLADTIEQIQGYRTEERPCFLLTGNILARQVCKVLNPAERRNGTVILA